MSKEAVLSCSSGVMLWGLSGGAFWFGGCDDGLVKSTLDLVKLRGHGVNPDLCEARGGDVLF